jgi:hypothetical protein
VQTEDKAEENLIFLCVVEVQPTFDASQRDGQVSKCNGNTEDTEKSIFEHG